MILVLSKGIVHGHQRKLINFESSRSEVEVIVTSKKESEELFGL